METENWEIKLEYFQRNGKTSAAIDYLEKLVNTEPYKTNYKLWWELAQYYTDPVEKRRALSRVVRYNSSFRPAYDELTALIGAEAKTKPPKSRGWQSTITASLTLLFIVAGMAGFLYILNQPSIRAYLYTLSTHPTATATAILTATLTPTATELTPTATLNPTHVSDTVNLSPTVTATLTTIPSQSVAVQPTSSILGTTRGVARFYQAPIYIYVDISRDEPEWLSIYYEALAQLSVVLPLMDTPDVNQAHIVIKIVTEQEYINWSGCPLPDHTAGCGWIVANTISSSANSTTPPDYRGYVWLSMNTPNPLGSLLHEMMHALGVRGHSSNAEDVIYSRVTDRTTLSENDIQILKDLYGLP